MSEKASLLGLLSDFGTQSFPAVYPLISVYACMTDAHGRLPLQLRLIDADEEHEPVFLAEDAVDFPDRNAIIEWSVRREQVRFPRPGHYRLQLFVGGKFVVERHLIAHQVED